MNLNSDRPRLGGDVTREGLKRIFKSDAATDGITFKIYDGADTKEAVAFRPSQMTPLSPNFHTDDFSIDGQYYGSVGEYIWTMRFREILKMDLPDPGENPRDGDKYNIMRRELGKSYSRVMEDWTLNRGFFHWQKAVLIRVRTDERMRDALRETHHKMMVYAFDGDSFFGVDATRNTFRDWASEVSARSYLLRYPMNFPLSLKDISTLPFICNGYNVFGAIYMALRETLYRVNINALEVQFDGNFSRPQLPKAPKRRSDRALFDANPEDTIKRFQAEEKRRRSDPPKSENYQKYRPMMKDESPRSMKSDLSARESVQSRAWRGVEESFRSASVQSLSSIAGKVGNIGIEDAAGISEDELMLCTTPVGCHTPVPIGDLPPRPIASSGYGSVPDVFREHHPLERSHSMGPPPLMPFRQRSPVGLPLPMPQRFHPPMGPPLMGPPSMGPPRFMEPPMGRPPIRRPVEMGPPHHLMGPPAYPPVHHPAPVFFQTMVPMPQPPPATPYRMQPQPQQFHQDVGPAEVRRFASLNDLPPKREITDRPGSVAGRHYATVPDTLHDPYQPPAPQPTTSGMSRRSVESPEPLSVAVADEVQHLAQQQEQDIASPNFDWLMNVNCGSASPPIEDTADFIQRVKARAQSRQS